MGSYRKRKQFDESIKCFPLVLADIPDELVSEILVRLPIKFVHRCKCVSKRWHSLISGASFSRQYTLRKPKFSPSQFILLGPYQGFGGPESLLKYPGFTFSFLPTNKLVYVLGSTNGLVLCGISLNDPCPYYICNPITMQWIEIPPPTHVRSGFLIGFVCDSKASALEFASSIKYNVVCMPKFSCLKNQFQVEIFSFDTMEWSKFEVYCPRKFIASSSQTVSVCCNGVLYWLLDDRGIVAYDLYNKIDQCSFIDLPKALHYKVSKTEQLIGVCQDCLRFCQIVWGGHSNPLLELWEVRNSEKSEWRLLYYIRILNLVLDGFSILDIRFMLVAIDAIDQEVLYVLVKESGCFFQLNLKKQSLESGLPNGRRTKLAFQASPFVLPWWPTPLPALNKNLLCNH